MSIFRYVRGCVFALFAIAMFGATATAAEKLTVRLSWTPFGLQSPFHLANQMGWFQAEGLDVHVEDGKGSAVTVQLMGTNRYDIGHGSLANMAMGRDKGMKLVAIGGGDIGLIVAKSSGVKSAKDLVGKKLVYTPGSLETPFLDPFLKNIGMTRSQLTLMAVDAPAKVATFMTGRADGVFTAFPFFIPLLRDRKPSVYFKFADHGLRLPGVGLIAHEDTIKEKPEALRKFMKVFNKSWQAVLNDHEAAADAVIAQRPQAKLDRALLIGHIKAYSPYLHTPATKGKPLQWQSPDDWDQAIGLLKSGKLIKASANTKDFYSNAFVPMQ